MKRSFTFLLCILLGFSLASIYAQQVSVTNAETIPEVLYYTFDEAGSDSTENFAVPGRGDEWAQVLGGLTMGDTGQFGSALVGTVGTSNIDYVNTGWATDIGTSSWTISLWLNNLTTNFHYLFGDNTADTWRCFMNGIAGDNNILLRGGGMTDHIVAGVAPGPSVVTWVYDAVAGESYAYLNGVWVSTVVQGALNINGSGPFKVGGFEIYQCLWPGSLIDEFRLYERALDSAEVANTWNINIIPVELTSFSASVEANDVTLNWETATEINNSGFQVERKSNGEYKAIGFVPGFGTTTEPKDYSFFDVNLNPGTYAYRLKQLDYDGTFEYSDPVEVDIIVPDIYSLHQNYPNPFNPSTTIKYQISDAGLITLKVYDVLGNEIMIVVNEEKPIGSYEVEFDATNLTSGIYFYRLQAGNFVETKKMVLMK